MPRWPARRGRKLTPMRQLEEWVKGRPACPNTSGECCPDFSCCNPDLLWHGTLREAFLAANPSDRETMLMGALADMLRSRGHHVSHS